MPQPHIFNSAVAAVKNSYGDISQNTCLCDRQCQIRSAQLPSSLVSPPFPREAHVALSSGCDSRALLLHCGHDRQRIRCSPLICLSTDPSASRKINRGSFGAFGPRENRCTTLSIICATHSCSIGYDSSAVCCAVSSTIPSRRSPSFVCEVGGMQCSYDPSVKNAGPLLVCIPYS